MKGSIGIPLYLVLVAGCAGPAHQLRIVPSGRGTFIIPSQDLMGTSSSSTDKAKAYNAASAYCMKRGREIETVLRSANEGGFTEMAAAEIEFRCVPPAPR